MREALEAIARVDPAFAGCTIESVDVTDVAPRQPMSLAEIIDGAVCRARAVDANAAGFAVGLEGGLHETAGGWALSSWAAVTDGVRWGYGAGPIIVIPDTIAQRVRAGQELGDVMDSLAGGAVRGTRGAWGILTRDLVGRRDAFRLAVIAAFAPFYNPGLWDSPLRGSYGGT